MNRIPQCPRCEGTLKLERDAFQDPHGAFLPASLIGRRMPAGVHATLRVRLAQGIAADRPCASCRSGTRRVSLDLPDASAIALDGCQACDGWWIEREDADRLRSALLSRTVAPPRNVGGYGGNTLVRDARWTLVEGLGALLHAIRG